MADALEARFDTKPLETAAEKAEPIIFRALFGALNGILWGFNARHVKERMTGRPGVIRRTGQLARSWKVIVQGSTTQSLRGMYASNARHAMMQEFGGVQRPRNAKMLAIPLPAARTAAGISRYGSPLRSVLAPAFPGGTFVAKSKAGNLILFGKADKDSEPIALFVLKDQVTIPPRLGTRDLWRQNTPQAQAILNGFVVQANTEIAKVANAGAA